MIIRRENLKHVGGRVAMGTVKLSTTNLMKCSVIETRPPR
jgi:hypothetical protein